MKQNLIQMPKMAEIQIGSWCGRIRNHEAVFHDSLFIMITNIIRDSSLNWQSLVKFEEHGIGFETAIEECVRELECRAEILARFMYLHYVNTPEFTKTMEGNEWNNTWNFSASETGKKIAWQFIEKIRSCGNWEELHGELNLKSKFYIDMKSRIIMEIQQCRRA